MSQVRQVVQERTRSQEPLQMKPKPKIPSPCPKCGVRCEGYREAKRHCRNKKREANFFKVKS